MANYRSWADFESCRDHNRHLVIYGAGAAGRYFINRNKLNPLFFCDRNAEKCGEIISNELQVFKVLTVDKLKIHTAGMALDVLVALTKTDDILSFLHTAELQFSEESVIFLYHMFDYENRKPSKFFKDVIINGEYVFHGKADVWNFNIIRIMDNLENIHDYNVKEHLSMLKSCYKNPDIVTVDYLRKQMSALRETFSRGCFMSVNENRISHTVREKAVRVHLFGNCQLQAYSSSYVNGFENYLYQELNRYGSYDIYNYGSRITFSAYDLYRQLMAVQPEKNSIVLFICRFNIEELRYWVLSGHYCDLNHCRFIGVPFADIYDREVFSNYEKYLLKKMHPLDTANTVERLRQVKVKRRKEFLEAVSGYHIKDFYYFSRRFLRSEKALFVDGRHLGDWGNEALALDVADMILRRCAPVINPEAVLREECRKFVESLTCILPGFTARLDELTEKIERVGVAGAIVMNANPFTLGHRFLIETAANACEHLYVFVVEEDRSQFCFADRIALVREGTRDMENVSVLPGSELIISGNTFSEYFIKDQVYDKPDVTLDLHIFGAAIAQRLNIKTRFVGEEPLDPVTRHYNEEMKRILPGYGVNVVEIKRRKANDEVISASRVRKLLKEGRLEETEALVPETTLRFLKEKYGG